jgi:hypothetical protein
MLPRREPAGRDDKLRDTHHIEDVSMFSPADIRVGRYTWEVKCTVTVTLEQQLGERVGLGGYCQNDNMLSFY